jgi:hypothetical protein
VHDPMMPPPRGVDPVGCESCGKPAARSGSPPIAAEARPPSMARTKRAEAPWSHPSAIAIG